MRKNLVAMLLAVGIIATATGCGSTESTSTTSTTEYVTDEVTTKEAQVEETTEYVEETSEEVVEETVEAVEEITVDELVTKVREAMEVAPYVVSDYTVFVNAGKDGDYNSYYNKEANTMYNECELNGTYWVDFNINTIYLLDASNSSYTCVNDENTAQRLKRRALNTDDIYKTAEADSAVYTLDNITDGIATVTINYITEDGNNATAVMTINTETGLIESNHYTNTNENGEVVSEIKLELSYPTEGTPEYDEFIQKTTIPAEAIEAANNQ